jgi:(E)-4-hydroxy-3-methylbut-2-enyl-diphosphate synthase
VKEVEVAWEILKALGLRERGPVMIACPSCGRDNVGVENLARVVEERLRATPRRSRSPSWAARSNGPGEAGDADFGIAGGRDVGFVYAHGRVLKKVSSGHPHRRALLRDRRWIEAACTAQKRLKMAKPARSRWPKPR